MSKLSVYQDMNGRWRFNITRRPEPNVDLSATTSYDTRDEALRHGLLIADQIGDEITEQYVDGETAGTQPPPLPHIDAAAEAYAAGLTPPDYGMS